MWKESSARCVNSSERANSGSVRSGYAAQAHFVPIPRKDYVVSHPVKEWKVSEGQMQNV